MKTPQELTEAELRATDFLASRGYEGVFGLHTALLLEGKTIEDFSSPNE